MTTPFYQRAAQAFAAVASALAVGLIDLYRVLLSPLIGPVCRFQPTCSAYARDAVLTHGVVRGMWLAARRILRCHPWAESGYDPVPACHHDHRSGTAQTPTDPSSATLVRQR